MRNGSLMPSRDEPRDFLSIPSVVRDAPATEQIFHRQFVLEHLEFIADVLTAEQIHHQRDLPSCCPTATPESLARRRTNDDSYPCQYTTIHDPSGEPCPGAICNCGDPLAGSDDPLDTVAAAALARSDKPPSSLYFAKKERQFIDNLREEFGSWKNVASSDRDVIHDYIGQNNPTDHLDESVTEMLLELLESVEDLKYTDEVTLCNFSTLSYSRFQEVLSELPGISEETACWLLLTAFDKPVWPADTQVDSLLCSLGLLTPGEAENSSGRHEILENKITDRLLPMLHRALAGHAWEGSTDQCGDNCEIKKFLLSHRLRAQQQDWDGLTAIDLFAGAGGLSCGLAHTEFDVQWAIDYNSHATATYRLNHPKIPHENVVCDDIREIDAAEKIQKAVGEPDLVVGGPPCQSLSVAGYRSRLATDDEYSVLDDERTSLYKEYLEIIQELQPRALIMENVEGIMTKVGDTGVRVIDRVLEGFDAIGETAEYGYEIQYQLVDLSTIGLPQSRSRVILLGIREDILSDDSSIERLFEELGANQLEQQTVRQALAGLPKLLRGEGGRVVAGKQPGRPSDYMSNNGISGDTYLSFNHRAREHPMSKDQRLFDEALDPGDTGWDVKYKKSDEYADLIEYDVGSEENPRFKDKYRMLEWDEPAPTVVAHLAKDANSFVLPDYYEHVQDDGSKADKRRNRGITPREAARLQSFPDDWIFLGPFTSWFRQIGNAVPPMAGRQIGDLLADILTGYSELSIKGEASMSESVISDD
ncbi:DNA cytosine methyltransferase [Haloarcula sediminis]|uniref:DNA cytosine methyltransferase n=1 Tax=Haloarcula sediminis TaxID=3111777 RepID=UPI002D77ECB3|nr:DNA cytosine methyltransferase [Haloarcula sp. CK38]